MHSKDHLTPILLACLAVVLVLGVSIPRVSVPAPDRRSLEQLPPQLAKVIERKKREAPKPEPKPVQPEKPKVEIVPKELPEPKPEPAPQVVKAEPLPPPPKPEPKVQATQEQRAAAKETAKKHFGGQALSALQATRSELPLAELQRHSRNLSNEGSQAVEVGNVVQRELAGKTSGGVDTASLTQATVGEQLASRELTQVSQAEAIEAPAVGVRSKEELSLAFEQYKANFYPLYRMSLRSNPTLKGTVKLSLEIQPDGSVSRCEVSSNDLNDTKLHKRLAMKCRQMQFKAAQVAVARATYPIYFEP